MAATAALFPAAAFGQVTFLNSFGSASIGQVSDPEGIAVGATGNVYVLDAANNFVDIFNSTGAFLSSFGSQGSGNGQFRTPLGIAVGAGGNLYVADQYNQRVDIFSNSGVFQTSFGSEGTDNGQFVDVGRVAIGPAGDVYVTDASARIQIFNSSGAFESSFTTTGTEDALAVSAAGTLYAVDTSDNQVEIYNSSGAPQGSFGTSGSGNGQFNGPQGVAVGPSGDVYIADGINNRVQIFNSSGVFQSTFGTAGGGDGQFSTPTAVAVAPTGVVYVCDAGNHRVVRLFNPADWISGSNSFADPTIGPTSITLSTPLTLNTSMNLTVGNTLSINSGGSLTLAGGALAAGTTALGAGGSLTASAFALGASQTLNQSGGTLSITNLTLSGSYNYSAGTISTPTSITVNSGGSFNASSATINVSAGQSLAVSGGPVSLGALNVAAGGTLQATQGGNIALSQTSDLYGDIVLDGGTSLSASFLQIEGGGLLSIGKASVTGTGTSLGINSGGEMRLGDPLYAIVSMPGMFNSGLIDGSGRITGGLLNNFGEIDSSTGQNLTVNATNNESGALVSLTGGTLHFTSTLTNMTGGQVSGYGTLRVDGGLTNQTNGYISLGGGSTVTNVFGTINNGGLFTLAGNANVFGTVNNNAADLFVTGNSPNYFYGTVNNNTLGFVTVAKGSTAYFLGPYNGSGPIINSGAVIINGPAVSGSISGTGTLTVGAAGAPTTLQLTTNSGLSTQSSLTINPGSTLDLTNNHLVINYAGGPDPIASVAAWIASGYSGGSWNGSGIISSTAAVTPGYAVGYADSADPGNPAGLASGTLEAEYTLIGDADLNRTVNGVDFGILAANFNKAVSRWDQGDFNYDGIVNGIDFTQLAINFNKAASGASAGATAADFAALDAFAAANGLLADVPEPASLALAVMGAAGILTRRRKRGRVLQPRFVRPRVCATGT
jgi:hypothetical protein